MRHFFTAITAISLLLCLGFLVLMLMTWNSSRTFSLGESATNTRTLKFGEGGDLTYDSIQKGLGRVEMTQTQHDLAGISYIRSMRGDIPGHNVVIPLFYPVVLFAILPLLWVLDLVKGRNRRKARVCDKCGAAVPAKATSCPACGAAVARSPAASAKV